MNRIGTRWILFGLTALAASAPATGARAASCGDRSLLGGGPQRVIVALAADQTLVRFGECNSPAPRAIGPVTGLAGGDLALVGIDYRVQDGLLYGVGDGGGVYTIDPASGAATLVSQLTVALDGTRFGVDFNPAADRLRIVSDAGQNLRHNVNAGGTTAEDDDLDYPPATPPNGIGPTALGVAAAAYTNNDLDPSTGTSLYVIDAALDQVAIQAPPNNGSLGAVGKLTADAAAPVGFDVYSRKSDGEVFQNQAFATLVVGGATGLYRVNLQTGKATFIKALDVEIIDVAIPID